MASFDDLYDYGESLTGAFEPIGSALNDYTDPTEDEYADPNATGPYPRTRFSGIDPEDARQVLENVPQRRTLTGFGKNLVEDVGEFGGQIGSLIANTVASGGTNVVRGVAGAIAHPIDTAKGFADLYKERYTPQEGESVAGMIGRRLYEDPFESLMDASAVLQGPAGAARIGGLGKIGALEKAAAVGRGMDPFILASKAVYPIAKSVAPDATARYLASKQAADTYAQKVAVRRSEHQKWLNEFNDPETGVYAGMNESEQGVLHAYAEGRFHFWGEDAAGELIHTGDVAPIDPKSIRKHVLDAALPKLAQHQQNLDVVLERDPVLLSQLATKNIIRDLEKEGLTAHMPEYAERVREASSKAYDDALEAQQIRATVSQRTGLDVAKHTAWEKRVEEARMKDIYADIEEVKSMIPHPVATTPQEALELMGPGGGVIIPHSMEALTRDMSTVKNVLTKFDEASIWKDNEGKLFKQGLLQHMDLKRAMWAAHRQATQGQVTGDVYEAVGKRLVEEKLGEVAPKGYKPETDVRLTGNPATGEQATHQILAPGYLHHRDLLQGQFQPFLSRVLEAGEDAAMAEFNLVELAERFTKGHRDLFPLKQKVARDIYIIPKGAGKAVEAFERSFNPPSNAAMSALDKFHSAWNFSNLNIFATRMLNNGIGDGAMGAIQGVHPFSPRGIDSIIIAGRAMAAKGNFGKTIQGWASDEVSQKLGGILDLPGVSSGGLTGDVLSESGGWFSDWLAKSPLPGAKGVGRWGNRMQVINEGLENFWRAASITYELKPGSLEGVKGMAAGRAATAHFAEYVEGLGKKGAHEVITEKAYGQALEAVNHTFGNYDRATATGRAVLRHVMPYHKFYQHAAKLLIEFPFEHPLKGQLAKELGKRAQEDVKETLKGWGFDWETMVPDYLRTGVPVSMEMNEDGTPTVMMLNSQGPNPFSFMSGDDIGEQGLGLISPIVKLAFEQVTGINLFRRRRYLGPFSEAAGRMVDPRTGEVQDRIVRPNPFDNLLKQFRLYQTAKEFAAQGRVPTDTATLLDMIGDEPGAWALDDRGFPRRKPQAYGALLTPASRFVGLTPSALQYPTLGQDRALRGELATNFADAFQRGGPELQEWMLAELQRVASEPDEDEGPSHPFRR